MPTANQLLLKSGFTITGDKIPVKKKRKKKPKRPTPTMTIEKQSKILLKNEWLIKQRTAARLSPGERAIAEFLKENNVEFIRECFHPELNNGPKQSLLFYDFFVPSLKLVIEFDGKHHFENTDPVALQKQRDRDRQKDQFCRKKGFALLRIKYSQINKIPAILCRKFDELSPIL